MTVSCYMCNANSSTVEHVPPKCLFPERKDLPKDVDLRKQLITVPSCEEHNTKKSKDDEYLLYCLVMSVPSNEIGGNQFLTKIMRAIDRNPRLINQFFEKQRSVIIEDTKKSETNNTVAVQVDRERLERGLSQLSRALYFHHFNKKWVDSISVYPNFLLSLDEENAREINEPSEIMHTFSDILFTEAVYYGENPDVFKYQVVDGGNKCHKLLRLHFYNGNKVTVILGVNTANKIDQRG